MKIVILDDSKTFLKYIKAQLHKINIQQNIHLFNNCEDFYSFIEQNDDIDVIFIDYHLKHRDGFEVLEKINPLTPHTYKILITSDSDPNLKEKALELGFDTFVPKEISLMDFRALMKTIQKLRKYINEEIQKQEKFQKILKYKEYQEKLIHQKQNKIMKNELEMFFDDNYMFETYFSPKDLLTGDTIYTKKLSENSYFAGVIDAMGKGLAASLTSFNSLSFLKHSIKKAIEYNDFNFQKLVNDFQNYVQTILLDNEILCATLIFIENKTVHYANFGNPPILKDNTVIRANNFPIRLNSGGISIDSFEFGNKLLIASDGIFESPYKGTIYYKRIKELYPKIRFIKEITDDFKTNAVQTDDICMVNVTKDTDEYNVVFEEKIELNKDSIDGFLKKLYVQNIPQIDRIHYILHEILTNTLEYGILKIKNKDSKKEREKIFQKNDKNKNFFAKIIIMKNNENIRIDYTDTTEGFDVQTIKDAYYRKYHGRGIKIIKHLSEGLFFNENGTAIKIFLKAE
jgi:DNA-binding NarL/FixJ family response regulator